MRFWMAAGLAMLATAAQASEFGDRLPDALYSGTLGELAEASAAACEAGEGDACFVLGLEGVITAYETFAQGLYRHGAVVPNSAAVGMLLGMGTVGTGAPANPDPEPLTYDQLRDLLAEFSATLDAAAVHFEAAGEGTPFVVHLDPLRARIDLDGDGTVSEGETLGAVLEGAGLGLPAPEPLSEKERSKGVEPGELTIGFDNADAIWFAGYANITAVPVEMALAHDFSGFFDAYLHRVFPEAGLPMGDYTRGGTLMMDADTDAFIADLVAALHTARFPVTDPERLAGVLERLGTITTLSRRNWELILAETDDDRELVPSPSQTSLVPDQAVTEEIVAAWLATLDQVDRILAGELLLPHWRFRQGFNLRTYFETATETDLVMLFTGHAALPYLAGGPIADAESFAELNRAMGDEWPMFAIWFN